MSCVVNVQVLGGIPHRRDIRQQRLANFVVRSKTPDISDIYEKQPRSVDTAIEQKAASRVRSLLSSVKESENDLFHTLFRHVSTEYKMTVYFQISAFVVFSSIGICLLCGLDPFGGMNVWHPNVENGMLGFIAAIPPVLVRLYLSKASSSAAIEDYKYRRNQETEMLFSNLSFMDSMILIGLLAFSVTFLIYPGAVNCFSTSADAYFQLLDGLSSPDDTFQTFLFSVAAGIGLYIGQSYSLTSEAKETVLSAASNSERFYKLTVNSSKAQDAAKIHSAAFRKAVWNSLQSNQQACLLAGVLTFAEIVYGGMMWKATNDLLTTLCFAFSLFLSDFLLFKPSRQ